MKPMEIDNEDDQPEVKIDPDESKSTRRKISTSHRSTNAGSRTTAAGVPSTASEGDSVS